MRFMAALSTKMLTDNMLLSVFFLTGALAACPDDSALFITAPLKMEALSGSCLQIPCNFSDTARERFDGSRTTFGVWIKNDHRFKSNSENVIFNSSGTVTTYPMNITGNLSQNDCTTMFSSLITTYTDRYYFRIENRPLKATAVCNPVQITVKDSPPSPRIEISGELKEKESVNITCSAFTPCPHSPPKLTWNLQQDAHNQIEENADRTFTTKIQKTITLSDKHDGYNITCSSNYSVNEEQNAKSAEEKVTLSVSYVPKDTLARISPSCSVSSGSWVNLTCSSRAKPAVNFTWFKISKDGPMEVYEGDFYSFNVTDGGVFYCVATNDLGNQTSSRIRLTIKDLGMPHGSFQWWAVLGGIIGIIVLVVCVCILVSLRCFQSTNPTPQQTQQKSQTNEELTVEEPNSKKEEEKEERDGEDIHYGEIDFSKLGPEPSSNSVQDIRQQQDTVYAQVKVSKPTNSLTQTTDGPKDLYAQVKRN